MAIRRERERARRLIRHTGDVTHGGRVTRTGLDLKAIRDSLSNTIIDKVVRGGEGVGLTSSGIFLTSQLGTCIDDTRIKS